MLTSDYVGAGLAIPVSAPCAAEERAAAAELAAAGEPERHGRGRLDRSWSDVPDKPALVGAGPVGPSCPPARACCPCRPALRWRRRSGSRAGGTRQAAGTT